MEHLQESEKGYLHSVLSQNCPRCRKGKLFAHGPYHLRKFFLMNDSCSCCGQTFHLEPSFYDGAMYVSYAIQVALFVTVFVALSVLHPQAGLAWHIGGITSLVIVFSPMTYRLSRSLWIHFFVKYNRDAKVKCSHE